MRSSIYWKQRFELLEQSQHQLGIKCYETIEKQYRQAQREIEGLLTKWYARLASNNQITIQEARKMLSHRELEEFKWTVQDYIRYGKENAINGQWMKQLENASARFHISRLEALKIQTQQSLEVMFDNQLDSIDTAIRNIYINGYYHTAFEIQKGIGIGWNFSTLNEKLISKVINEPWASDGKNFSQRIWGNRQKLVSELNKELTKNMILGQDPQKAIDAIAKKMKASKKNVAKLVMTEEAFFSSVAQKDCFKELDVEQFQIVATLDAITSQLCRTMDGKVFPMSQWEVGVTAPPFHPYCRTTTVPYFEDNFGVVGERAARGKDGKVYYVPADMTYREWERTFVDGDSKVKDRLGLFTNNNKNSPRYYDYKDKTLDIVEQEISKNNYEIAVCFDKSGKAIFAQIQTGEDTEVEFTKYQLLKMKGNDVTHNHPLDTPPSPEDLYLMKNYKANSFRTTGKKGTYILEYDKAIENLPEFEVFSDAYDKQLQKLQMKYVIQVKNGISEKDAIIALGEEIWEELYKIYGVKPYFKKR